MEDIKTVDVAHLGLVLAFDGLSLAVSREAAAAHCLWFYWRHDSWCWMAAPLGSR